MKPYCRLKIPYAAGDSFFNEFIDVPPTSDGIKMAAWWGVASLPARVKVAREGAATGSYIEAWRKNAGTASVSDEATEQTPAKDALVAIVKRLEDSHETPKP